MKRRRHKFKTQKEKDIPFFCVMCKVVDVREDDPELECVCKACWVKLDAAVCARDTWHRKTQKSHIRKEKRHETDQKKADHRRRKAEASAG